MSKLKLEVGKRYVRRDGVVTEPLRAGKSLSYPFFNPASSEMYTDTGSYINETTSSPKDLVSEYVEQQQQKSQGQAIDEQTVAAFNELVRAGKIGYRLRNETGLTPPTTASKNFVYELLSVSGIKIKLPDSGYECALKNDRVFVGCQDFGPITNFKHVLTMLLGDSAEQTSEYHDPIKSIRSGLLHRKGQITWNDADVLLKFLSEAEK
jgi:hypothetical protein